MGTTNGNPLDSLSSFPAGTAELELPWNWRDAGIRDVLAHPAAMSDLLRKISELEEVAGLDLTALRREPPRQVGEELELAKTEMVWSAPITPPDGKAAKPLHFTVRVQPTPEWFMAMNMMIDVARHSMQLLTEYEIPIPQTVPVVFYTGERPWDAPLEVADLIADPTRAKRMRYFLIDLCRLEVAEGSENLVDLLAGVTQGASEAELLRRAQALYRRLVALGDKHFEGLCFDLVRALCKEKWPEENWMDCTDMEELVDVLEERTVTWPEKWKARYMAEGHAQGRAQGRVDASETMLWSLEGAVRARFGESVARSFGLKIEIARQADSVQGLEILDAICQCVMLSENAEQLLAGLESIRPKTA